MKEITVGGNVTSKCVAEIKKQQKKIAVIEKLVKNTNNQTAQVQLFLEKNVLEEMKFKYLGKLKAWIDSLPEEVASDVTIDDVPLELYIKMFVDSKVLDILEAERGAYVKYPSFGFSSELKPIEAYEKLVRYISGYGYCLNFVEERYKEFFKEDIADCITAFAKGYHEMICTLANSVGFAFNLPCRRTEEEVFRNWTYFLRRDSMEYSLEGIFINPYVGHTLGSIYREEYYNHDLYKTLRKRRTVKYEVENVSLMSIN